MTEERKAFVEAVKKAQRAANGDSNDAQIAALTDAVELAKDLLSTADLISLSEYEAGPCTKCAGCGKVANSDDQEAWTWWENLPVKSAAAVILGLVRPIDCPVCHGTGKAAA